MRERKGKIEIMIVSQIKHAIEPLLHVCSVRVREKSR